MSSLLDLSRRLLALSQTGLHFCAEEYDRERYREIGDIAARLLELQGGASAASVSSAWFSDTGYATPKVEVRGAIFRDDRVLMVRERADGKWTVPGGWADVNDTPSAAVLKEIEQESGFTARILKLAAVVRSQQAQRAAVAISFLESVLRLRDHRRRGAHQLRDECCRVLPAGRTAGAVDGPRHGRADPSHAPASPRSSPADRVRLSMSEQTAAPEWFTRATAAPAESRFTEVDGTPIHYLSWNAADTDKPALLFAHGFRAHARWWSFIAPFFLSRFRIVSIDFAGMGDSGNRREYTPLGFVHDILGVLDHAGFDKATLVGHSFGGGRVARACAEVPERVARAVIIDSHMRLTEEKRSTRPFEIGPRRVYPTYEVARSRFRLVPPENRAAPYVLDYVARHSLKEVEGGWSWKFDEHLIPKHDDAKASDILGSIKVPVTFIYGDASAIVSRKHAHEIVRHIPNAHGPIAIPQSHHHVLLDQPLSLVAALRAALY